MKKSEVLWLNSSGIQIPLICSPYPKEVVKRRKMSWRRRLIF